MSTLIRAARLHTEARVLDQLRDTVIQDEPNEQEMTPEADVAQRVDVAQGDAGHWPIDDGQLPATFDASGSRAPESVHAVHPQPSYEEYRERLQDELRQQRQDAVTQGYAEGRQSGLEAAADEYRERLESVSALITGMHAALKNEIDGLTDIGADIVFEAVVRILGRHYLERAGIVAVVREVIRHAKDRSRLVIRVSPADHALLDAERESLIDGWNSQQVDIIADDRVELGGCLLESPAGNLDGRLEVQLQQLRETLLNARLRRSESVFES